MSSLNIPLIPTAPGVPVEESLRLHGESFEVANVNWKKDWPYAPSCSGKIGRTEDFLLD